MDSKSLEWSFPSSRGDELWLTLHGEADGEIEKANGFQLL